HTPRYVDDNRSVTGQFNHTLSKKAFYSVGGSWFYTERKRGDGVYFDNVALYGTNPQADFSTDLPWFWPGSTGPVGDPLSDTLRAKAEAAGTDGHVFDDYLRRQSSYWAIKGDYTQQANAFHQLKAGGEFDRHTLRFYEHYFPVNYIEGGVKSDTVNIDRYGFAEDGTTKVDDGLDGARHPTTASIYLQDKYERGGLVTNVGLRWDYIDTDTPALVNENLPLGSNGQLDQSDLTKNTKYNRISPRLGIGFPVTEKTVMHANWGKFIQQPNLQDLYVSYQFLEHKVQTGGYFVGFGNPNLKPEETTAYEV